MNSKTVTYEGKTVYIGLDVHRSFFVSSCICEGVVVKRCRMDSTAESVLSFISKYFPNSNVQTVYEAGFSGFWLHRKLESAGISNIVIHPASLEVASNNKVKTDKRDSLKLAEQLSTGRLRGIRVPDLVDEDSRLLVRTRQQLMKSKIRVQSQIRMRLHQFGLFPRSIERVLTFKDVENVLKKLTGELKYSIKILLSQWKFIAIQIKEIDQRITNEGKDSELEILYRSVPGIGKLTARVFRYELGDMSQFKSVRSIYSFTGLTPSEYSSGDKIQRGRISRQGSSTLRHLLVEAAWKAVRKDIEMKEFFERLAKTRGKKRAIVGTARKLIGKVRAVVRDKEIYENEVNKKTEVEVL